MSVAASLSRLFGRCGSGSCSSENAPVSGSSRCSPVLTPVTSPPPSAGRTQPTWSGASYHLCAFVTGSNRWTLCALMSTNQTSLPIHTGPSPRVAPTARTETGSILSPPCIDEIFVPRAHPRIVGGEEQRQRGDVGRLDPPVHALRGHQLFLVGRSIPPRLSRSRDAARDDRRHADVVAPELAREAAGQALDPGLSGLVSDQVAQPEVPGDRAEVEYHATARGLHRRHHGLAHEEQVAEVGRDALVPVLGRDVLDRVAVVVGGVVDQHVDPAKRGDRRLGRDLERREVAQVAGDEARGAEPGGQRFAGRFVDVEEGDFRALADEGLDQPRADPGRAAGDDDPLAGKARVSRARHAPAPSRPRRARLAISAPIPSVHGSASLDVTTRLTSRPSLGLAMATRSPTLWVKPRPGSSRSCTGANSVPRNSTKPSGYWCSLNAWRTSSS